MREIDRKKAEFSKMMVALGEVFDKKITHELLEIYWRILEHLSMEKLQEVFDRALRTCRFFPKPAELLELANGNIDAQAELAWNMLLKAIKAGAHVSVIFEDGHIADVVQSMGGWENVCSWTIGELKYRHREFCDAYKALVSTFGGPAPPAKVVGQIEQQNAAMGYLEASDRYEYHLVAPTVYIRRDGTIRKQLSSEAVALILEDSERFRLPDTKQRSGERPCLN